MKLTLKQRTRIRDIILESDSRLKEQEISEIPDTELVDQLISLYDHLSEQFDDLNDFAYKLGKYKEE